MQGRYTCEDVEGVGDNLWECLFYLLDSNAETRIAMQEMSFDRAAMAQYKNLIKSEKGACSLKEYKPETMSSSLSQHYEGY